jgi:hypothetical protein
VSASLPEQNEVDEALVPPAFLVEVRPAQHNGVIKYNGVGTLIPLLVAALAAIAMLDVLGLQARSGSGPARLASR